MSDKIQPTEDHGKSAKDIPTFADLGKSARDLFTKGFNYGYYKVGWKPRSLVGIDFILHGSNCHKTGAIVGSFEMKRKWTEHGVSSNLRWNTDNRTEIGFKKDNVILAGVCVGADAQFVPLSGKAALKFKTSYKNDKVNTEATAEALGPSITAAGVFSPYHRFLIGGRVAFDRNKSTLAGLEGAFCFHDMDTSIHLNINDTHACNISWYQKINDSVSLGAMKTADGDSSKYGLAIKYSPSDNQTLKAKIDNCSQIGLSFEQSLTTNGGPKVTLSALIDAGRLDQPAHQFGFGIEI